jgi:hypothetical protein
MTVDKTNRPMTPRQRWQHFVSLTFHAFRGDAAKWSAAYRGAYPESDR